MDSYYCIFWSGGHILEASWGTMRYIRQRGHELATREPKKEVRIICSLTREGKCEILGHWRPDGLFINRFGDLERLSPDGQSMETVKKHS